jgi:hypothetical protein
VEDLEQVLRLSTGDEVELTRIPDDADLPSAPSSPSSPG